MLRGTAPTSTLRFDGLHSVTVDDQIATETACERALIAAKKSGSIDSLNVDLHIKYLRSGIRGLASSFQSLDASRPWIVYWIVHALDLLGYTLNEEERNSCIDTLRRCQHRGGGFGGGPGQLPHLAPSYAAVNALVILGGPDALAWIDRPGMQRWLSTLRQPSGGWIMHQDGELDIRGAYCAASVAVLLNLAVRPLFENTVPWIVSCQTHEGGFAAVPGAEAHGGYAFCGLAALCLLGDTTSVNLFGLLRWVTARQMAVEGGFQGRVNKLVDGCYSFWVGGVFPLLEELLVLPSPKPTLLHPEALCDYVLGCCQFPAGGLIDKPGKHRDFYHTCYCLSGLACLPQGTVPHEFKTLHKAHNVGADHASAAKEFFSQLPVPDFQPPMES